MAQTEIRIKPERDTQTFEDDKMNFEKVLTGQTIKEVSISENKLILSFEDEDGKPFEAEIKTTAEPDGKPYLQTCLTFYGLDSIYKFVSVD